MRISELLKERLTLSFEVFPPKEDKPLEPLLNTLEHLYQFSPDFISCTYGAGGSNAGRNTEICENIKHSGKTTPITHFTCINSSKKEINEMLNAYLDMGIDHILALRGDIPKGYDGTNGEFTYANELIRFIKERHPQFCVAMSGVPEKHIESPTFEEDITHLRIKQDCGGEYIMTQLCHDVEQYERWVEKIRKAGIYVPIVAGVMPVLTKDAVIRMAVMNGCSIPRDLSEIIGRYGENPEDFKKAGKEYTVKQIHKYINAGINGLHIYSLNKHQDVEDILGMASITHEGKKELK
ncbi:MAG TPA: methylenetetrahydrofolate reductase [Candidatus Merdenecus merdavium]|nr:methylenetetrahydrofolate reductase [Candidatus Merdenecus merdavium]